jgi:hypothetical protein
MTLKNPSEKRHAHISGNNTNISKSYHEEMDVCERERERNWQEAWCKLRNEEL